jgi:hypothetical protein
MTVDFDDSAWPREVGSIFGGYGYGHAAEVYLLCARTRFGIADMSLVGPLRLSLSYRGGVIIYLNGHEVARAHMPSGKIEPLTLAEDYPIDVFLSPEGGPLPPPPERGQLPAGRAEAYQKRFRHHTVELPPKLLRQGTNVLAIELHRSAIPAELDGGLGGAAWNPTVGKNVWGTCGLVNVVLTAPAGAAVAPNPAPMPEVLVWNCDPLLRPAIDVKRADPLESLRPIRLAAPRNGVSSSQVVVSAAKELADIGAVVEDLKQTTGEVLSAKHIEVRYATVEDRVPRLCARPSTPAQVLPIFLTARLSKGTPAGLYRGTLRFTGLGSPVAVPIELTVYNWTLPEVRNCQTSVTLLHCPEAVARHYHVPLWSDEHFRLLARSMALMGYAGNRLLSISAIGEDFFGDHPLIVFRKEQGKYIPDFRFARRYLELYDQQAGPPQMLSVQVWNYAVSRRGFGRDGGTTKWLAKTIKVRLLEGDKLIPAEMPVYTSPGTEETWAAVAAGVKRLVRELGWKDTRLLWGTGGDNLPNEEIVAFFKKIAPDMYWRVATHGGSVRNWGLTPEERTQPGGLVLGYANLVRRNVTRRPLVPDCPFDVLKRDGVTSAPAEYLSMPPLGRVAAGYSGIGFLSFDNWPVITDGTRQRSPIGAYVGFGNIGTSGGPFVAPGPDGADPSPQLEALREGLQVTEAVLHLRAALADPQRKAALKPELAAEVPQAIQTLLDVLESNRRLRPTGAADVWPLIRRIYELVAEVAPDSGG